MLSDASRDWLKQVDPKTGKSNGELVARALGVKALRGDPRAYCALRDTTTGAERAGLPETPQRIKAYPLPVRR